MSLWIEIHCDVRADTHREWYAKHLKAFCLTDQGNNVGAMFRNQDFHQAMRVLAGMARNQGWVKTHRHGWVCPNCATTLS